LQWGDIQFGSSETDSNRYILVQRNFVYGKFTPPKSKRSRRVDLSRQLRKELLALRDKRLLEAFLEGKTSIADDLIFPSRWVPCWTRRIFTIAISFPLSSMPVCDGSGCMICVTRSAPC